MANHTLDDHTTKETAIAPLKADQPLSSIFPIGVPVAIPEGDVEPTLLLDGEEHYEIPLEQLGDTSLVKVAELYTSDRVSPQLSAYFAIHHQALVPAAWIGGVAA